MNNNLLRSGFPRFGGMEHMRIKALTVSTRPLIFRGLGTRLGDRYEVHVDANVWFES